MCLIKTKRAALLVAGFVLAIAGVRTAAGQAGNANAAKVVVGSVTAINGNNLTVKPDSGADVKLTVVANARVRRVAPGQTDLKTAAVAQLSDIQSGDRVEVVVRPAADGSGLEGTTIVVMKAGDVAAKNASDQADWQKRGVHGIVSSADPASGTVLITDTLPGGTKQQITIHTTKSTVIRRYAQGSVQFADAKIGTLDSIKPGDQLQARGDRTGNDVAAEEVVSGGFQNVSGVINSVDVAGNTISVQDIATKKEVVVKITPQSKIVKLPPQIAQAFAARFNPNAAAPAGRRGGGENAGGGEGGPRGQGFQRGGGGFGGRGGTAADLQQIVNRQPAATLADMTKGDTVMIVASTEDGRATAIQMVGGVDAILRAAPEQSMNLSAWNLGGGAGGGGGDDAQ